MEIIFTEDGSNSIYLPEINESYHSTHGAIQESSHIFINLGLKASKKKKIRILEIGFGTGLNALLTTLHPDFEIDYTSLELFPLELSIALKLNYHQQLGIGPEIFHFLHQAPWGSYSQITENFKILKIQTDLTSFDFQNLLNCNPTNNSTDLNFDLIYFDAFSPEKQPELWSEKIFSNIYDHCNKDAILTTYCAKGQVRRNLQAAGFKVERLPGPPGKREILRATKY